MLSPFLPYILSCVVYSTLFFSLIFFPFCQPIEIRRSRQLENPFPQSSFSCISKKKLFCFITIGSTFFVLLKDFAAAHGSHGSIQAQLTFKYSTMAALPLECRRRGGTVVLYYFSPNNKTQLLFSSYSFFFLRS